MPFDDPQQASRRALTASSIEQHAHDPLDALRVELLAQDDDDALDPASIAALTDPLTDAEKTHIVDRLQREQATTAFREKRAAQPRFWPVLRASAAAIAAAGVLGFLTTRDDPSPAAAASRANASAIETPVEADPPSEAALAMQAELDASRAAATQLDERAASLVQQAMYDQAEALLRQALALREHVLGPDHEDVADSLTRLAGLYQTQHDYDKAEPLYFRALEIRPPVVVF